MSTVESERLILRDIAPTDWDALNTLVSDPAVTRFMHFASWDEAKRREWFTRMVQEASNPRRGAYDNWAITLRSNRLLIGWLFIGASHPDAGARGCGFALGQRFWGQGYMPEALRAAFAYEFTSLGARRIIAECETANGASARVMQKSGMNYVGTFYDADFQGSWANRHHYQITAPESETP
jgi:ribosomal-protein-alanine N-acetyltransferase